MSVSPSSRILANNGIVMNPSRNATANKKSNPVNENAGMSATREGSIHCTAILKLRISKKSANAPPIKGAIPAPRFNASDAAAIYDVDWSTGDIFNLSEVTEIFTPAIATPNKRCRKTKIGMVPPCRSGSVVNVQAMITKKYSDEEIDSITLLPKRSAQFPHT